MWLYFRNQRRRFKSVFTSAGILSSIRVCHRPSML